MDQAQSTVLARLARFTGRGSVTITYGPFENDQIVTGRHFDHGRQWLERPLRRLSTTESTALVDKFPGIRITDGILEYGQ